MKKRELIYGSLIIALGVFIFIYAGQYVNTTKLGQGSTSGAFFPRIMSAGLVISGIVIILGVIFSKHRDEKCDDIKWPELFVNISALIIYYFLMKPLGFVVDSALITAFIMYRIGCRNYISLVVWSIAMPLMIFCIFYYGLYVSLPLGVLETILPKF